MEQANSAPAVLAPPLNIGLQTDDRVSPLQDGLQLFQNGSGSSDVPVTPQFSCIFTEPLKHNIKFCINEHGMHT